MFRIVTFFSIFSIRSYLFCSILLSLLYLKLWSLSPRSFFPKSHWIRFGVRLSGQFGKPPMTIFESLIKFWSTAFQRLHYGSLNFNPWTSQIETFGKSVALSGGMLLKITVYTVKFTQWTWCVSLWSTGLNDDWLTNFPFSVFIQRVLLSIWILTATPLMGRTEILCRRYWSIKKDQNASQLGAFLLYCGDL